MARSADDVQGELFETVAGVSIPAPRFTRVGSDVVAQAPPGPPVSALAQRPAPLLPTPRGHRALPRAPRQTELFPGFRSKGPTELQRMTRAFLPPDQALVVEKLANQLTRQFQSRQPTDIGLIRSKTGKPVERMLSPEDLQQEILRLVLQRRRAHAASPAELDRFLYPKARSAAYHQVRGMTRPTRVPKAERKILAVDQRIREARERDPRFALLSSDPGEVFRVLASDPKWKNLMRREGTTRRFGTESGISEVLGKGLPSFTREARVGRGGEPLFPTPSGELTRLTAKTKTPLDELLAKEAEAASGEIGPKARMDLALRALTERQREVVTRRLGLDRPAEGVREIARDLKIDPAAVHRHYKAGFAKLESALKTLGRKPAPAPEAPTTKATTPAKTPEETARELVTQRLAEARRRIENRRRWEYLAPIRRMTEKPPTREYTLRKGTAEATMAGKDFDKPVELYEKRLPPQVHPVFKQLAHRLWRARN